MPHSSRRRWPFAQPAALEWPSASSSFADRRFFSFNPGGVVPLQCQAKLKPVHEVGAIRAVKPSLVRGRSRARHSSSRADKSLKRSSMTHTRPRLGARAERIRCRHCPKGTKGTIWGLLAPEQGPIFRSAIVGGKNFRHLVKTIRHAGTMLCFPNPRAGIH